MLTQIPIFDNSSLIHFDILTESLSLLYCMEMARRKPVRLNFPQVLLFLFIIIAIILGLTTVLDKNKKLTFSPRAVVLTKDGPIKLVEPTYPPSPKCNRQRRKKDCDAKVGVCRWDNQTRRCNYLPCIERGTAACSFGPDSECEVRDGRCQQICARESEFCGQSDSGKTCCSGTDYYPRYDPENSKTWPTCSDNTRDGRFRCFPPEIR